MKFGHLLCLLVLLSGFFEERSLAQQPKEKATLSADKVGVLCVAFSPDGKTLASVGEDDTIKLWDVATGKKTATLEGHDGPIAGVAFSPDPDQKILASAGSKDKSVKLWDLSTGKCVVTLQGHTASLWCVAFSPDGKMLASASVDKTVKLWEVASGKNTTTLTGHKGIVTCVAFSPDGKTLASVSGKIHLWDVASGKNTATLQLEKVWARSVAFSPDGKTLASADSDGAARLWDLATAQQTLTFQVKDVDHTGELYTVAFSKDGKKLIAAGHDDGHLLLWDVVGSRKLADFRPHPFIVYSIAISPDGKMFATGSGDKTIKIWDFPEYK